MYRLIVNFINKQKNIEYDKKNQFKVVINH